MVVCSVKQLGSRFLVAAVLTVMLISSCLSSAFAVTELAYDDGTDETGFSHNAGRYLAVLFSLPSGWSSARLLTARFYRYAGDTNVEVHILGSDGSTELTTPFTFDIAVDAWNDADLTPYNIVVSGDFYIAIEIETDYNPHIGGDLTAPDDQSYSGSPGSWSLQDQPRADYMIRAVVESPIPVGGITVPANKLSILAPYLALIGLVGAVTAAVAIQRRKP